MRTLREQNKENKQGIPNREANKVNGYLLERGECYLFIYLFLINVIFIQLLLPEMQTFLHFLGRILGWSIWLHGESDTQFC